MPLPLYTMGQNQFDTSPLENALWKYAQHQEQQRQNAFRQQQIDMDRTRLGYEGERLGFERDRQPGLLKHQDLQNSYIAEQTRGLPLQRSLTQEQILAARQARSRAETLAPYDEYKAYQEQQLRQKQIDGDPLQAFDPEKQYGFKDATAPGGIRWIDLPTNGSPGDKDFQKEAAKTQADRFNNIIKEDDTHRRSMAQFAQLDELSRAIGNPHLWNTVVQKYGGTFKALGINPNRMSDMEAFTAIVSRLAPNMKPAGAGATSDFDLQTYFNSLPALQQTQRGRELIINQNRMLAEHSAAARDIATKVLTRQITRAQAEQMLQSLPDPLALWKKSRGLASPTGEQAPSSLPRVNTPDEARRLPPGTQFILPDGRIGTVPNGG